MKSKVCYTCCLYEGRLKKPKGAKDLAPDLWDVIARCLIKDVEKRITLPELMIHPWITNNGAEPLANDFIGTLKVNEQDMKQAITKLSLGATISLILGVKRVARRARRRLSHSRTMQLQQS